MIFSQNREQLRHFYFEVFRKQQTGASLEPLEQLVATVISEHPEYHQTLQRFDRTLDRDYRPEFGETNPFLHMGLHITIREQIRADRPVSITALYHKAVQRWGSAHEAEHRIMECLGKILWEAQRAGRTPDDQQYLRCLRALVEEH